MIRLNNKKVIFIVIVIALILLGLIGKGNNEEKRMIDNSIKAIEARDYEYATEALGSVVDGNNKKVDKLWNVVVCYQKARDNFWDGNIENANKALAEMDNDYKKYDALKEDVEKLKADIKEIEQIRNDIDKKIDELHNLVSKEDYYTAKNLEDSIENREKASKEQKNRIDELIDKCNDELFNEDTKIKAWKICDEKFDVKKAMDYIENSSVDTEMFTVELDKTMKYTEKGFKYFNIVTKVKGTNEVRVRERLYSTGYTEIDLSEALSNTGYKEVDKSDSKYYIPSLDESVNSKEELMTIFNSIGSPFDYVDNSNGITYSFNPENTKADGNND